MADAAVPGRSLFVIFGGRGDLSYRKLLPALCRLLQRCEELELQVLGVGTRADIDDEGFAAEARQALVAAGLDADEMQAWCDLCLHYESVGKGTPEDYRRLGARIEAIEREHDLPGDRTFYLALPEEAFIPTIRGLGENGLHRARGWTRLVVEKPFGRDLASARELDDVIHRWFDERQVYRIDHYLGKETVQNLLMFRFANSIFEYLWNRDRVKCVQITVAEDLGVEHRGRYYERAGALRDMVQNHITQLLTLIAMEIPSSFEPQAIRDEKLKALRSMAPIRPGDVVVGQYGRGSAGGHDVPGYREEDGVAPDSRVETFAAARFEFANWRWYGVPFFVRTGKRLPRRISRIAVVFRQPPVSIFRNVEGLNSNVLQITIQPEEGFDLGFEVKVPGQPIRLAEESLRFRYADRFARVPEAYETLLQDILIGDQTLFVSSALTEASWRIFDPILASPPALETYAAGSWGPKGAEDLVARSGALWVPIGSGAPSDRPTSPSARNTP